ncbi:MAG: polyphosphate kinase 2 family protein [Aestuariivirga sp.]|uniref:polyphosphate kinase 2 family protein n=1 Tax=Aestuariivirga sp. TaxID=2650926 RepID=UPI00301A92A1
MAEKPKAFGERYMVKPGKPFKLADCDPRAADGFTDKEATKADTVRDAAAIDALQDKLFAEGKRSLLVILQGIDCSGKDGTVRAVFNHCGPIGVKVAPFKAPNADELAQDYLWRVHKVCPPRGYIGIFNRSHYEDVLVVKVRGYAPADVIEKRYDEINAFEKMLSESGTKILKFMLNISKEEQAERLTERIEIPEKRWKFKPSDLEDRALWNDYMKAYEVALTRCSTHSAPWYVIPADRNWARNAAISRIVRETLEDMNPQYPEPKGWDPKLVKVA